MDIANSKDCPISSHTTVAVTAISSAIGTKTALILSAIFAIGALDELASSTNWII